MARLRATVAAIFLLAGCVTHTTTTVTSEVFIGGTVQGLSGTMALGLEGAQGPDGIQRMLITSDGAFAFPKSVPQGSSYIVSVIFHPASQACTVARGVGVAAASVTSVQVVCRSAAGGSTGGTTGGPAASSYALGGSVVGLTGQLGLQNGGDTLTVNADGSFSFPTPVAVGSSYSVSISAQPVGQLCQVFNGAGVAQGSLDAAVTITCTAAAFTVGGTAVNLPTPLSISLNGSSITVSQNGNFTFPGTTPANSPYVVTLQSAAPSGYTCTVTQGTGTVRYDKVTTPVVICNAVAPARQFVNPINGSAVAAPSILRNGGYYYAVMPSAGGTGVDMLVATTLAGLNGAFHTRILSLPTTGGNGGNCDLRNPKLALLDSGAPNGWALYYSATSSAATGSCGTDPAQRYPTYRTYAAVATITDPDSPGAWAAPAPLYASDGNSWSVDGVAFNANNRLYFVWSGVPTGTADGALPQALFIAPMDSANAISATRTQLSVPNTSWEQAAPNNAQSGVQEAPAPFLHGSTTSLAFAAGSSQQNSYATGLLVNQDGNLLNPAAWTKSPQPVLAQNGNAWGVGGASMFTSPDELESWVAFNSFAQADSPGALESRAMRLQWAANGTPLFSAPVGDAPVREPSNVGAAAQLCTAPSYGGTCTALPFGLYSAQALQAYGIAPNSTASLSLMGRVSAVTFSEDNAGGAAQTINFDLPAFAPGGQFASIAVIPDPNLAMKLVDSNSGDCLEVPAGSALSGAPAALDACAGTDNQRVNLASLGDGTFHVVIKSNGLCLNIAGGSNQVDAAVVQSPCAQAAAAQAWSLVSAGGARFTLVNQASQLCLTVPQAPAGGGTALTQEPCTGAAYQTWSLLESTFDNGGAYTVQTSCQSSPALCLEVPNQSTSLGTSLDLQPCAATNFQAWRFVWIGLDDDGHGFYHVQQQNSGYSLDYSYGARTTAGQVIQYQYLGAGQPHWNQNWELVNTAAGTYRIENRDNGLMVALLNGAYSPGTNLNTAHKAPQCAQRWQLMGQ